MTYERLGHERLEDLLGLCEPCHEFLSGKRQRDPCSHVMAVPPSPPLHCSSAKLFLLMLHLTRPMDSYEGLFAFIRQFEGIDVDDARCYFLVTTFTVQALEAAISPLLDCQPNGGDLYMLIPLSAAPTGWLPKTHHDRFRAWLE